MRDIKIGKAVLIAPLVAPVLYFVGALVLARIGETLEGAYIAFVWIMSFGAPVSYLATTLLGIPFV